VRWQFAQGGQAACARIIKAESVLGTASSRQQHRNERLELENLA
jgi:hypothetical protein